MCTTYESFTIKGKLVYQKKKVLTPESKIVYRAVHQKDGSWWFYCFYEYTSFKGSGVGTPVRGKKRQESILKFVEEVKNALREGGIEKLAKLKSLRNRGIRWVLTQNGETVSTHKKWTAACKVWNRIGKASLFSIDGLIYAEESFLL